VQHFKEGDTIEARWRDGSRWYPGKVKAVNPDGSYNIRYHDGGRESGVPAKRVRRPGVGE
jgi:hypothetical protein